MRFIVNPSSRCAVTISRYYGTRSHPAQDPWPQQHLSGTVPEGWPGQTVRRLAPPRTTMGPLLPSGASIAEQARCRLRAFGPPLETLRLVTPRAMARGRAKARVRQRSDVRRNRAHGKREVLVVRLHHVRSVDESER